MVRIQDPFGEALLVTATVLWESVILHIKGFLSSILIIKTPKDPVLLPVHLTVALAGSGSDIH